MIKGKDLQKKEAKQLYEKYGQELKINSFEELKASTLPDYLAQRYSTKFGPENSNYNNYQNDKNLNEVYVFEVENEAYFVGTENAVIPGYIAKENLKDGNITLSKELSDATAGVIFASDHKKVKEFEENFFHGDGKDLENLEKILEKRGKFSEKINEKAKQIDPNAPEIKLDLENKATVKERAETENVENGQENTEKQEKKQELNNSRLPEHVVKYCIMAGIVVPKAAIDTKASEAAAKIDEPRINKNGGNVTIIKVRDDSKSVDKYLVFQDEKLIIPGNRDDKIDKVVGKRMQHSKDGKLIKPLDIDDEEQYFEYSDSQGTYIKEKLEENMNLSIEDLEEYKKKATELLEKFSEELYIIEETAGLNDEQKDKLCIDANQRFNTENENLAREFGINYNDMKAINIATDERTQNQVEKESDDDQPDPHEQWWKNERMKKNNNK